MIKEVKIHTESLIEDLTDEGLVESSGNLGSIRCSDEELSFLFLFRSCKESSLDKIVESIHLLASPLCAKTSVDSEYPAWEYHSNTRLQEVWCSEFKKLFNKDAEITATHGGLECGVFSSKLSGLDCISVGPEAVGIHTVEERLSIRSTEDFIKLLLAVLENI